MEQLFVLEIREFLDSYSLKYYLMENHLILPNYCLKLSFVSLNRGTSLNNDGSFLENVNENSRKVNDGGFREIRVYEDLWFTKGDIIKNRLRALLGKGEAIFARKCVVANIDANKAIGFLEKNHILGYSRAKFFYGLFYCERLVAVAAFSAPRPIKRESGVVSSFEWVRYASVGSSRVVGGMGRLLSAFVEEKSPQEVMSYADLDWGGQNGYNGSGVAYKKLGFELVGKTPPVKFMVDPKTYQRYSLKKLLKDRKYNSSKYSSQELLEKQFILLSNSGNFKFLRSFSLL